MELRLTVFIMGEHTQRLLWGFVAKLGGLCYKYGSGIVKLSLI